MFWIDRMEPTPLVAETVEFDFLLQMVEKYRQDVHHLNSGATTGSGRQASDRLGLSLPEELLLFLEQWNGADLFRGALCLRAFDELTAASVDLRNLVLFAETHNEGEHWAFAEDGFNGHVLGLWAGGVFQAMNRSFRAWLAAQIEILDSAVYESSQQFDIRLKHEPDSPYLIAQKARDATKNESHEEARTLWRQCTSIAPNWPEAYVSLSHLEPSGAEFAQRALMLLKLPMPNPSFAPSAATLFSKIDHHHPDRPYRKALLDFCSDRIENVLNEEELRVLAQAVLTIAGDCIRHGEREKAKEHLEAFIQQKNHFDYKGPVPEITLLLSDVQIDLGLHDEAEKNLRPLLSQNHPFNAAANLRIGKIAVMRHEPWAIDILKTRFPTLPSPEIQAESLALIASCQIRMGAIGQAEESLAIAEELAYENQLHQVMALVKLGQGDIAKHRSKIGTSERLYQEAIDFAEDSEDEEIRCRILVRQGDLLRQVGEKEKAFANYMLAADCFSVMGLPIRQAWTRVKMGEMGDRKSLRFARDLFKSMDDAAGVAAADAMLGVPADSLSWHLERAQEHARKRTRAQRSMAPLTRADSDRPERRLGGHRLAIAACGDAVVLALRDEMVSAERELQHAEVLPTHHKFARYLAAADLISAHRSYRAAEILLEMARIERPNSSIRQALIGAMTRSGNMALVDGLIKCMDLHENIPGMLIAAETLGWRREKMAVPALRRALHEDRPMAIRRMATIALGRIGDASAVGDLLAGLEEPEMTEETAVALLLLGEWKGLDEQAQALIQQEKRESQTLGEIVGRYGGPAYLLLLLRAVDNGGPQAIGAILGLGYLGDPRVVDKLIGLTASRNPAFSHAASQALEILTGHYESTEESLLRSRWTDWWSRNEDDFQVGCRYRHGELMSALTLIDRMSHDDGIVRRSCYDELVISTGVRLPFDVDGPWRVQCSHRSAWKAWWRESGEKLPRCSWLFHGTRIG